MDEKNIPVFDFTDEQVIKDALKILLYAALNSKTRKKYEAKKVTDEKIEVTITNNEDEVFKCIYKYRMVEDIYHMIENDESLNLKGIYVKDFDITEIENYEQYLLKDFDANYSFWDGKVSFYGANFGDGDVSFFHANFGDGDVRFDGANCGEGDVRFDGANFGKGDVSFKDANFGKGNLSFYNANFGKGDVSFKDANFGKGDVRFNFANFGGEYVSFDSANFGEGAVSFDHANFGEGAVSFFHANFGKNDVSFQNADVQNIYFNKYTFSCHADLRFKKIDELILRDCIIEKTFKCNGVYYNKLSFLNTVNLGQIYIDWDKNNVQQAIVNGEVKYYEKGKMQARKHTNNELASQFRMLKENFHNIGYYDDEDKAYYAYMFYKRKAFGETPKNEETKKTIKYRGVKRAFYWLFEKIGGYGTKRIRFYFGCSAQFLPSVDCRLSSLTRIKDY